MQLHVLVLSVFVFSAWALEDFYSKVPPDGSYLTAVIPHGKMLNLVVDGVSYQQRRWIHNGTNVPEKCETTITQGGGTLVCPSVDDSDAGVYEFQALDRDGEVVVMLRVNVTVHHCEHSDSSFLDHERLAVADNYAYLEPLECFCSKLTDQCTFARNLFRTKIKERLFKQDIVSLQLSGNSIIEVEDSKKMVHPTYFSLSKPFTGNLLRSYGGYFSYPPAQDYSDEDSFESPTLILRGTEHFLVYTDRRELSSHEVSVLMTEASWRHLNGSYVSRSSFMEVLTNVQAFYVRAAAATAASDSTRTKLPSVEIVLDSAAAGSPWDRESIAVTTIEACRCPAGYGGLSCEVCAKGYYRRNSGTAKGTCVSLRESLRTLKRKVDSLLNKSRTASWYLNEIAN